MKTKEELRTLSIFFTLALWGTVGVLCLLHIGKLLLAGQSIEPRILATTGAALITILGVLFGHTGRLVLGIVWATILGLGLLFLFWGYGANIPWMQHNSMGMLFGGVATLRLMFLDWPDKAA